MREPPSPLIEPTRVLGAPALAVGELAQGARVGAWRVVRTLGQGGMGNVYLAERADASFDKQVALKLVQGLLTPVAQARFAAEKQALARLEHPHIARLIDAGESEAGWPYLVMEYVHGMPIDEFLAGRGIEDVLAIFLQLCDAVAYAHRQLVLHRDIKPSNVLVNREGDAKLLDFGIAKLLQAGEGMNASHTVERAYTPEYASPEQVFGRPIGVASDIYSMGVLLYRLLTGISPHAFESTDTAVVARVLRDDDIVPPSRAVPAPEAGAPTHEHRRRSKALAGDLDTIVMAALQKQPERRYASVDAFAEDIRHYLAHEPIRAQPDSFGYRARKFLRRNTVAVAASVAVALALVGGLAASLWQAHIANQQRALAERRFEDVRSLAHGMIFELNDSLVKLPGSTAARALLVKQALAYLQRLGEENDESIPLRRELAQAWLRVGDVQGAPDMPNLGDLRGALASYAQAAARVDAILREAPGDPAAKFLQAQIALHRADALFQSEALADAEATYRDDIALWTRLRAGGSHEAARGLARAQSGMANVLFWSNKWDAALALYERSQATMESAGPGDEPLPYGLFLGQSDIRRGEALDWLGHTGEARAMIRRGLERLQAQQRLHPDDATVRHAVGMGWMKLAENSYDVDDKSVVLADSEQARTVFAAEAAIDPADMRARRLLALAEQESADALVSLKRFDEAMARYRSALQGETDVAARDPHDETVRQDLGNTWYGIAGLRQQQHDKSGTIDAMRRSLAVREALVASNPHSGALRRDVAQALGDLASQEPDHAASCRDWIASDALWQALVKEAGASPSDASDIAAVHKSAAACR